MTIINIYNPTHPIETTEISNLTAFLFEHLGQYGDPENDIKKAVDYALGKENKPGGLIVTATDEQTGKLKGVCVVNKTGMSGYIPENILVYIATDKESRGQGIGKNIMQNVIKATEGDIALHCENENPARHLYEKLGFKSKYLEMRLKK
ncbi:GNAT family N-acetyltransferase [Chryseobacterium profundimaris]|uniref:Acetyltransferase (GNAT) domain-containing protein n=1 Tax=Chryseobacterium profundimaris TaxID=1387275 RepID=A0ABY1NQ86_9FLAO|nr:GNAT family N-acetyltransferase [Chryseobacterium profundimaris]SMP15079.1 Acetyltransferase (GNAT) domain-containing protein [Chryseobacterium profundimaris]